jgi:hypothetical protein
VAAERLVSDRFAPFAVREQDTPVNFRVADPDTHRRTSIIRRSVANDDGEVRVGDEFDRHSTARALDGTLHTSRNGPSTETFQFRDG